MAATKNPTPLMVQYFAIKHDHPDSLLFFQVGDFFELFFDDAKQASAFLAIALTKRGKNNGEDISLCGVPVHALNHYLVKLIKGGFKVAICEQMTKPEPGKVVERAVTRVLTPGTLTDAAMLDQRTASYLFSLYPGAEAWGLLFSELLTAQLYATMVPAGDMRLVETELARFFPDEIIVPAQSVGDNTGAVLRRAGYRVSAAPTINDVAGPALSREWMERQFDQALLRQLEKRPAIEASIDQFYHYLKRNQEGALSQFRTVQFYEPEDYLVLDAATQRNLEIIRNVHTGTRKNTLLQVVDRAKTAMGSRTIRKWLLRPLVQRTAIEQRLDVVEAISTDIGLLQQLEDLLGQFADIERIIGRIALGRATRHDYLALNGSLKLVPALKKLLEVHRERALANIMHTRLHDLEVLVELLDASLEDDPMSPSVIKKGFDAELERLRELLHNGKRELLALEQREVEKTGINSLKVGYNNVAGYYIEVTNPNLKLVPDDYQQYQKLSNRQRFTTTELKHLEHELMRARTQTDAVEAAVYEKVKEEVEGYLSYLRQTAQAVSYLDGLYGLAATSYDNGYVRPTFHDSADITIEKGRHPVVEQVSNSPFIANDTDLTGASSLWIVTGPNMGGKSTYLRQVALINLLAQCGCFVPAAAAQLPILDRIFTRIGAGDDVAQGKSTFLVEMEETAVICQQATKRSLVILDEVGRGTSTYDGMALAQAIIEYLHQSVGARCLFATHYHELTELATRFDGIENYYFRSTQKTDGIVFLHELAKGIGQGSFGLEVARLAQLPSSVVDRAQEVLSGLHQTKSHARTITPATSASPNLQRQVTELERELSLLRKQLASFSDINLDEVSPRAALELLWQLKQDKLS